ncbi:CPBP family intramembrane glutamic endopeptidase [Nonomuraea candida]|uniref:CPBP family intramembrane glutamic endopeptidase n=1 Tax=Nonomuraea candida TaxID=359159 RepID=UPI000694B751|nr:CPBP family intramembrane glutamic endopeptidase [Nonomuraea candida]
MRNRADLIIFLAVAFGGAWLAAIPLWSQGLRSAALPLSLAGLQLSPALGVLAVWLATALRKDPAARRWPRLTGLTLGERPGRTLGYAAATWAGIPALIAAVIAVSALSGVFPTDLPGLSGYRQAFPQGTHATAVAGVLSGIVVSTLFASVTAFGEEWGWRGFLLPRLLPLGYGRAIVASGLVWGLWHAPLTLLGWNYPGLGPWAVLPFTLFCVAAGAVLGWLRLRTGSVWPAVIGHGALNAAVPTLYLVVSEAGRLPDPLLGGVFGAIGLLAFGALGLALPRVRLAATWAATAGGDGPGGTDGRGPFTSGTGGRRT